MAIQSNLLRGIRSSGQVLRYNRRCIAKVSGEESPTSNFSILQPTIVISNTNTSDQQHSMRYFSWGIGICSASIFGASQSSNNELYNVQRRGYRSSTIAATCEPSKLQKDNETDKRTIENSTSEKPSNSFFDMAQQWANDYTSKKDDKSTERRVL